MPAWYSIPDILAELRKVLARRNREGITLFFTSLSGVGKIHAGEDHLRQIHRNGRQAGYAPGRRRGQAEPIQRFGLHQ